MAVVKTILKLSETDAVVKVQGTAAAATIDLQTDLLASTQLLDGATQSVVISGVQWAGAADGIITITRNSIVIMTLQANAAGAFEMNGQKMIPDAIEKTNDVVVTISGAQAECWLRLKKIGGYKSKIETSVYGSYDNPALAGE